MKNKYVKPFAVAILTLFATSCSKSNDNNSTNKTCNLALNSSTVLTASTPVVYFLSTKNSGGSVSSVTYLDVTGKVTVNNPALPWTKSVTLGAGASASITANGTANKGGEIDISYAEGSGLSVQQESQSCGD